MNEKEQTVLPAILSPQSPERVRLPDERHSLTHKFTIIGGDRRVERNEDGVLEETAIDVDGYLNAGFYPDGQIGEIFLTVGKEGGFWKIYDAFMIAVSVGLQYGIPLKVFIDKFEHMRFEPSGVTKSMDIPMAKSIPDYIFQWLKRFVKKEDDEGKDVDDGTA